MALPSAEGKCVYKRLEAHFPHWVEKKGRRLGALPWGGEKECKHTRVLFPPGSGETKIALRGSSFRRGNPPERESWGARCDPSYARGPVTRWIPPTGVGKPRTCRLGGYLSAAASWQSQGRGATTQGDDPDTGRTAERGGTGERDVTPMTRRAGGDCVDLSDPRRALTKVHLRPRGPFLRLQGKLQIDTAA
jgi:hypothetical protein